MSSPGPSLSPLISYALAGLRRCWMPERVRFSYCYHLDRSEAANQSLPELDTFYTLNVLLGLSQLQSSDRDLVDIPEVFKSCCQEAGDPRWRKYTFGMALWSAARLGISPPPVLVDEMSKILADDARLRSLTVQDIGMLTSGVTAMALADGARWRSLANNLIERIRRDYYHEQTNLFFNEAKGLRRSFSSFASQVYSILALYQYGEAFDCDWAIRIANHAVERLTSLQGPRGEWPWFYYVPTGRVVDFYEVYSVHQHGMAPAFLHHAVAHGVPGAQDALVKGFGWLFGDNEMKVSMLRPATHMFVRSQVRRGELRSTMPRIVRSLSNAALGTTDRVDRHKALVLRQECRSYELGWILWSFGNRFDYQAQTHRREFTL
jgi:hypothetical protein